MIFAKLANHVVVETVVEPFFLSIKIQDKSFIDTFWKFSDSDKNFKSSLSRPIFILPFIIAIVAGIQFYSFIISSNLIALS